MLAEGRNEIILVMSFHQLCTIVSDGIKQFFSESIKNHANKRFFLGGCSNKCHTKVAQHKVNALEFGFLKSGNLKSLRI